MLERAKNRGIRYRCYSDHESEPCLQAQRTATGYGGAAAARTKGASTPRRA